MKKDQSVRVKWKKCLNTWVFQSYRPKIKSWTSWVQLYHEVKMMLICLYDPLPMWMKLLEHPHQLVRKCAKWKKLFEQKITHISECKLVYKYTIATVTVHICTVTVACVFIILLISRSCFFFSLSLFSVHNELNDFSSTHLLFPQMHTNTPTHKHIHTDKSTQR